MFALQRGLWQRLVTLGMPKAWVDALQAGLSNIVQPLEHMGPVKIKTNSQDNALELANYKGHGPEGEQSGNALWVSKGHGVTGDPTLAALKEGRAVPADTYHTYWDGTFDNYQEFNYPATFNDDVRVNDVIKYGVPARGSTILRVEFLTGFSGQPGSKAKAWLIDAQLQPIGGAAPQDGGGNDVAGWGVFEVEDVIGAAGMWGDCCTSEGGRGHVLYMSDLADGAAEADNSTRKDLGRFELLSYAPKATPGAACSVEVVSNLSLVNCVLSVCKRTITFCQPVTVGAESCG